MGWAPLTGQSIADAFGFAGLPAHGIWLLAQGKGGEGAPGAAPGGGQTPGFLEVLLSNPLYLLVMVMVLFYVMVVLPQQSSSRNQQKSLADTLKNLKKNDRVLTAAGIYGVVVNIAPETNIVSVRVDESTNTKLSITRESIVRVMADESASEKSK